MCNVINYNDYLLLLQYFSVNKDYHTSAPAQPAYVLVTLSEDQYTYFLLPSYTVVINTLDISTCLKPGNLTIFG